MPKDTLSTTRSLSSLHPSPLRLSSGPTSPSRAATTVISLFLRISDNKTITASETQMNNESKLFPANRSVCFSSMQILQHGARVRRPCTSGCRSARCRGSRRQPTVPPSGRTVSCRPVRPPPVYMTNRSVVPERGFSLYRLACFVSQATTTAAVRAA